MSEKTKKNKLSNIWNNFVNYISYKKHLKNPNLQLLEPLTCIVRLALLNFASIGTKVAISNNRLYNQKPTPFQGTIRWTYGNKRNELHNLYKPVVVCATNYNNIESDHINTIFNFAIRGLNKLKNTYSSTNQDIVCHSINLYKEILKKKDQKLDTFDINIDDITLKLYEKFRLLWNDEQIQIIANLLEQADKNKSSQNSFLNAIDSILQTKEDLTIDIINKFTENITS